MSNEMDLQRDVIRSVNDKIGDAESRIGVAVNDGAVMLTGSALTYQEKYAAERAALEVPGVQVISEGIRVGQLGGESNDDHIARAVARVFHENPSLPSSVQATVEAGVVTLRGKVSTAAELEAVLRAVQDRAGVRHVYNLIAIKTT